MEFDKNRIVTKTVHKNSAKWCLRVFGKTDCKTCVCWGGLESMGVKDMWGLGDVGGLRAVGSGSFK